MRPRARTSSSGTASSAAISGVSSSCEGASIVTIVRRCGSVSRIAAIFASWEASSHTIAQASESEMTQWHSSGEFVW